MPPQQPPSSRFPLMPGGDSPVEPLSSNELQALATDPEFDIFNKDHSDRLLPEELEQVVLFRQQQAPSLLEHVSELPGNVVEGVQRTLSEIDPVAALPTLGAMGGAAIGSFGGPIGTTVGRPVGAAIGGGLMEIVRQILQDDEISPGGVAGQAALGAAPSLALGAAGPVARTFMRVTQGAPKRAAVAGRAGVPGAPARPAVGRQAAVEAQPAQAAQPAYASRRQFDGSVTPGQAATPATPAVEARPAIPGHPPIRARPTVSRRAARSAQPGTGRHAMPVRTENPIPGQLPIETPSERNMVNAILNTVGTARTPELAIRQARVMQEGAKLTGGRTADPMRRFLLEDPLNPGRFVQNVGDRARLGRTMGQVADELIAQQEAGLGGLSVRDQVRLILGRVLIPTASAMRQLEIRGLPQAARGVIAADQAGFGYALPEAGAPPPPLSAGIGSDAGLGNLEDNDLVSAVLELLQSIDPTMLEGANTSARSQLQRPPLTGGGGLTIDRLGP